MLQINPRILVEEVNRHYGDTLNGYSFLDKIVQTPFCLPRPTADQLAGMATMLTGSEELEKAENEQLVKKEMINEKVDREAEEGFGLEGFGFEDAAAEDAAAEDAEAVEQRAANKEADRGDAEVKQMRATNKEANGNADALSQAEVLWASNYVGKYLLSAMAVQNGMRACTVHVLPYPWGIPRNIP